MPSAKEILENHDFAFRLKVSDGGAMMVGRDGVLLDREKKGEAVLKIHGRTVTVQSPITDTPTVTQEEDSTRVEISESGLKAAGQVAEALGIAIGCYTGADEALKQLIWIAKNVAWETKSNRHQFQNKWNPPNAQAPRTPPITSGGERQTSEPPPVAGEDA